MVTNARHMYNSPTYYTMKRRDIFSHYKILKDFDHLTSGVSALASRDTLKLCNLLFARRYGLVICMHRVHPPHYPRFPKVQKIVQGDDVRTC